MLGKLIKYEFKATARTLIPVYICLIIFTIISKLFSLLDPYREKFNEFVQIPQTLIWFGYGITMAAVFIVTIVIIIQRFGKNLLSDEGYLMNTLPVKAYENILCKLIVSIIWSITSFIVAMISVIILSMDGSFIMNLRYFIEDIIASDLEVILITVAMISIALVSLASWISMVYAAIALGYTANQNKKLFSFGAYLLLNIGKQFISLPFMVFGALDLESRVYIWLIILINLAFTIGFLFLTNYCMNKKLNLG